MYRPPSTQPSILASRTPLRANQGIDGATEALKTRLHNHQDRLQAILEHLPKIMDELHLAQTTRQDAINELFHQTTDIRSISPSHIPLANMLASEIRQLEQDAASDLVSWFSTSRSLQNLALLRESPYSLATVGPMPAVLAHYNKANYPKKPSKKLEKVLELFTKAAP